MSTDVARYATVPFHGAEIATANIDGSVFVLLRNVVETLGLAWQNEHRRITNDPILGKAVIKLMTAFSRGQEVLALPLDLFHGWLFKINLNTVNEEARPLLEAMQRESYHVLASYWQHGGALNPRMAQRDATDRALAYRELPKLLRELEGTRNPAARGLIHRMIVELCEERGYPIPAIEEIGRAAPTSADMAANFFDLLAKLEEMGTALDHSIDPAFLAIRQREVEQLLQPLRPGFRFGPHLRAALKESIDPLFVANKPIRSKLVPKTVQAWIFLRML